MHRYHPALQVGEGAHKRLPLMLDGARLQALWQLTLSDQLRLTPHIFLVPVHGPLIPENLTSMPIAPSNAHEPLWGYTALCTSSFAMADPRLRVSLGHRMEGTRKDTVRGVTLAPRG